MTPRVSPFPLDVTTCTSIAIVGGGASGALTAAHLAAAARPAGRRLEILLVEPGEIGQGIAYSTTDPRHRLNVPAAAMSAWPTRPRHFLEWLHGNVDQAADDYYFAARMDYGRYLRHVLTEAVAQSPTVTFEHIRSRACGVTRNGQRLELELEDLKLKASRSIDAAVLALGNGTPSSAWAPSDLARSHRFIADPWAPGALNRVPADDPVLLVGAGLTMADLVVALDQRGRTVHTVSRHGMLPFAHASEPSAAVAPPVLPSGTLTARRARRIVADHIRATVVDGGDWRCAVDSMRTVTSELWSRLDDPSRSLVLGGLARHWDRLRHRVAPTTGAVLAGRLADGTLISHTGQVVAAIETSDGVDVTLSNGGQVRVGAVVNCTGPRSDPRAENDPLVLSLFSTGAVSAGPMNIGLATAADGRILRADGEAAAELWTLGPLRRGTLWETTAIPEIRDQAAALAATVLGALPDRRIRRAERTSHERASSAAVGTAGRV